MLVWRWWMMYEKALVLQVSLHLKHNRQMSLLNWACWSVFPAMKIKACLFIPTKLVFCDLWSLFSRGRQIPLPTQFWTTALLQFLHVPPEEKKSGFLYITVHFNPHTLHYLKKIFFYILISVESFLLFPLLLFLRHAINTLFQYLQVCVAPW